MTTTLGAPVHDVHSVPPPSPRRRPVSVRIVAADPFVRTGLSSELRTRAGIELTDDPIAEVTVAVTEDVSGLPALLGDGVRKTRLVLIAESPEPSELWPAIENGLVVLLPRSEVNTEALLRAVADARAGRGRLPADQLGQVLRGLTRLHQDTLAPRELSLTGLSERETAVLRLLAEGKDTAEVADEMCYSERTVKNILHALTTRLRLRNRTHAVAYALRHGLI